MQVLTDGGYTGEKPGVALALGYFDGVHRGHAEVIAAARDYAAANGLAAAVFTFTIGANGHKGKRLLPEADKHNALAALDVGYCFEPDFESFQSLSPEEFFETFILGKYKAKAVFCGTNYSFGAHRAGNAKRLEQLCRAHGLYFCEVPLALYEGEAVSTSRIKAALDAGDTKLANALLGRECF